MSEPNAQQPTPGGSGSSPTRHDSDEDDGRYDDTNISQPSLETRAPSKRLRRTPQDIMAISVADLRDKFRQPLSVAAEQLGIRYSVAALLDTHAHTSLLSANSLKRTCRRLGIAKWPFRELQGIERLQKQLSASLSMSTSTSTETSTTAQLYHHLAQLRERENVLLQLAPPKTTPSALPEDSKPSLIPTASLPYGMLAAENGAGVYGTSHAMPMGTGAPSPGAGDKRKMADRERARPPQVHAHQHPHPLGFRTDMVQASMPSTVQMSSQYPTNVPMLGNSALAMNSMQQSLMEMGLPPMNSKGELAGPPTNVDYGAKGAAHAPDLSQTVEQLQINMYYLGQRVAELEWVIFNSGWRSHMHSTPTGLGFGAPQAQSQAQAHGLLHVPQHPHARAHSGHMQAHRNGLEPR